MQLRGTHVAGALVVVGVATVVARAFGWGARSGQERAPSFAQVERLRRVLRSDIAAGEPSTEPLVLPTSVTFDSTFNGLALASGELCIAPEWTTANARHSLYDLFGWASHLMHCDDVYGSETLDQSTDIEGHTLTAGRAVASVTRLLRLIKRHTSRVLGGRRSSVDSTLDSFLQQQDELIALGVAATEITGVENLKQALSEDTTVLAPSRLAADWVSQTAGDVAAAVETVFTAQILGVEQAKWIAASSALQSGVAVRDALGESAAFLFARYRGRPHPFQVHKSANATMALMQSVWVNNKNFVEHGSELEKEVQDAVDNGSFSDLIMGTAVDESWITRLQTLASGLPWMPDIQLLNCLHPANMTQVELSQLLVERTSSVVATGRSSVWAKDPLLSPFTTLIRNVSLEWSSRPLAEDVFFGKFLANISLGLKSLPTGVSEGVDNSTDFLVETMSRRSEALQAGDVHGVCTAERDVAFMIANNSGQFHDGLWVSLCPAVGDWRDGWKWPVSLIVGNAVPLNATLTASTGRSVASVIKLWRRIAKRLKWSAGRRAAPWSEEVRSLVPKAPILGLWPIRTAGAIRALMQDPHLVQYWSPENGPLGSGGVSLVMLDIAEFRCKRRWSVAAQLLGAPTRELPWWACLGSLVAYHAAAGMVPPADMPVGYPRKGSVKGGQVPTNPSEIWQRLQLEALQYDSLQSRPTILGAFGSWWPALQILFASLGSMLVCKDIAEKTHACYWAVVGRSVAELRPWEDFVGADMPWLLASANLVAWLADAQVLSCEELEVEETGELQCECNATMAAAPAAASQMLELLMEILLAGDPMNMHRLFAQLMVSESWQEVYSCAVHGMGQQRYLLIDRGDHELPPRARARLASAAVGSPAVPLDELLAP